MHFYHDLYDVEVCGYCFERVLPEFILLPVTAQAQTDFVHGVIRTHEYLGLDYHGIFVLKCTEGDPVGKYMTFYTEVY